MLLSFSLFFLFLFLSLVLFFSLSPPVSPRGTMPSIDRITLGFPGATPLARVSVSKEGDPRRSVDARKGGLRANKVMLMLHSCCGARAYGAG